MMKKFLLTTLCAVAALTGSAAATVGDTYTKVTSTADLTPGGEYILVYQTNAMGSYNTGKYYDAVKNGVNSDGDNVIIAADGVQTFDVVEGTVGGTYSFKFEDGKYMACTAGSNNKMNTLTAPGVNANFTISIADTGVATITSKAYPTNGKGSNNLQYNNGSTPRFSNYGNTMKDCTIYKKVTNPDELKKPSIACADNTVTITAEEGTTVYYTIDGNDPTTSSTVYSAPFAITETVTVKAIAVNGEKQSAVASFTATYVPVYTALTELYGLAKGTSVKFVAPVYVTACNAKYLYVTDNKGGYMQLYNTTQKLKQGQGFNGFTGTMDEYNGTKQLNPYTLGDETESAVVTPETKTIAEILGTEVANNTYVEIEGVTINGTMLVDATGEVVTRTNNLGFNLPADSEGKTYTVTGIKNTFGSTIQILPLSFEETAASDKVIVKFPRTDYNIVVDEELTLDATANKEGVELKYEITSCEPADAMIIDGNIVMADKACVATITASVADAAAYPDAVSATCTVTVTRIPTSIEFAAATVWFKPDAADFALPAITVNPEGVTYTLSSDNEDVVYAEGTEAIIGNTLGTAVITATIAETDKYEGSTATCTVIVNAEGKPSEPIFAPFSDTFDFANGTGYTFDKEVTASKSTDSGDSNDLSDVTATGTNGATIFFDKGTGTNPRYWSTTEGVKTVRIYKNSSMTISVPDKGAISEIIIDGSQVGSLTPSTGTFENGTWTPSAARAAGGVTSVAFDVTEKYYISSVKVNFTKDTTSIEEIEGNVSDAPVVYFDLQGRRVAEPAKGIFIKRQGNKAVKVRL